MFLSKEIDQKLIIAFEMYNQNLFKSLPSDEKLNDITFSEAFENKMQKLIREQKKSYFYLINTVGKKVAIIISVILISLTATTFGVKAIRETVIQFITETFEKFTKISVEDEDPNLKAELVKTAPQYIPEGYTLETEMDLGGTHKIIYNSQENIPIMYIQVFSYGTIYNVNTENVEYDKIKINSFEGIMYSKNEINKVVFADKTYMYTVYGQLSFDELIKIAESIKTE